MATLVTTTPRHRIGSTVALRLTRLTSKELWALTDQCLVSAANFLTNIFLARCLGVLSYGAFVSYYAILLYVWAWQLALFSSPMMSIAPQMEVEHRRDYLLGLNSLQFVWGLLTGLLAIAAGSVCVSAHIWNLSWFATLGFGLCVAAFQWQDALRRYYFVCARGGAALLNDAISYGGQAVALVFLYRLAKLTLASALWAVALTSAAAVLFGALQERLLANLPNIRSAFRRTWHMSRDLLAAVQLQWANSQGLLLMAAWLLGTPAAGAVRAMQGIAGPFNILLQAMENVIPIRAAQHYAASGSQGLVRYLKSIALAGLFWLGLPVLAIAVLAQSIVGAIYGTAWRPYAILAGWHAGYLLLSFFFRIATYFFRTVGVTKMVTAATAIMFLISLLSFFLLIHRLQASAVLISMVIGIIGALIYSALELKRLLARGQVAAIGVESEVSA